MQRFSNHLFGVTQGHVNLFADYLTDGDMWTGSNERERRQRVLFDEPFRSPPVVQVSISLWDVDTEPALRAELYADDIDAEGFDVVFRTWSDSRIARINVAWTAMGELPHEDDWELY